MFLEHGRGKLVLPLQGHAKDAGKECLTVVFLGAQSGEFSVGPAPEEPEAPSPIVPEDHPPIAEASSVRSTLGVVTLVRCGSKQSDLERLVVQMRSPRGAIEVIAGVASAPLVNIREALPERGFGPVAPRGNPGRPIEPGPLAERVVRSEERARAEGAQKTARVSMVASEEGNGSYQLRLTEGCHRVEIMAAVPPTFPHRSTDVDAEAHDPEDRVIARDRSESADARLDFCIGETARISVPFAGAAGMVAMVATDALWPIPSAVPNHWGARTRAGFALALRRRNAPEPPSPPILEALGVSGPTMVPVTIEPGRCYLAAVAVARGEPKGLLVSATIGDKYARDLVIDKPDGSAIAFCSDDEESARIDIDARGNGVWWTLALFALGGAEP